MLTYTGTTKYEYYLILSQISETISPVLLKDHVISYFHINKSSQTTRAKLDRSLAQLTTYTAHCSTDSNTQI